MCPGAVRASSIFPILSVILLFMGGLCIAASEFYKSRHNIILSSGILFVSAGTEGRREGGRQGRVREEGGKKRSRKLDRVKWKKMMLDERRNKRFGQMERGKGKDRRRVEVYWMYFRRNDGNYK